MAAGRFVVPPYFPARNRDFDLLSGAKLYVYDNLTTDKANIYTDEALTVLSANPVIANSSGQFPAIWAQAGTEAEPVLYSVSVTTSTGASPGNPFNFDNYRPSVDWETAAAALAEAAAATAVAEATAAAASADEAAADAVLTAADLAAIEAIIADAPDAPSVLNKLNRDGDNATAGLMAAIGEQTPDLTAMTAPIVDSDILSGYRSGLKRFTASVFADYIKAFFSASGGSALVGFLQSGTGAVARTAQAKMRDFVSVFDFIPVAEQAAIIAGTSTYNATTAINACLAAHKNVWVPAGIYSISSPVLFALQEQQMVFEDGAWFQAATSGTNGIACPHGLNGVQLINPGLIGVATTEAASTHTAILWNSNAGGTAPFGSATSDDMGGLVDGGRFKGSIPGTNGWNTFIHSNMAGGFVARNCVGKGLYGTASNYGYGHVFSGDDVRNENCDFDALITGQGRHAAYFGDKSVRSIVKGLRGRRFRKSGIAGNTGTTGSNIQCEVTDCILTDVALDADASASNGAVEFSYQGAATSGGSNLSITNVQVKGVGAMGLVLRGYDKVAVTDFIVEGWGAEVGGSYNALKVENCDDVAVTNLQSYSSAANNGGNSIQHVKIQESSRVHIKGGRAVNTGSGAQVSAVSLDATGAGTPDCIIDRFQAVAGSGSWSGGSGPFSNPTQNGSTFVPYKAGAQVVDTQTGADITLDASDGQSVFVLNSGATSILQILPAAVGQVVTLRMTGSTQIKQSNIYSPSVFNADANDTCTLVCGNAAGASSLWYEMSRSSN